MWLTKSSLRRAESLEAFLPGSDDRNDNDGRATGFVPSVAYEAAFTGWRKQAMNLPCK
jgi:hypothetical protein